MEIDNPKVYTLGPTLSSKIILHKNPKSLIHEIVSKAFSGRLTDNVKFTHSKGGKSGYKVKLEFRDMKLEIESGSVKKGENLLCLKLFKIIFPEVKTYFELTQIVKDTKRLKVMLDKDNSKNTDKDPMDFSLELIKNKTERIKKYNELNLDKIKDENIYKDRFNLDEIEDFKKN